MGWGWGSDDDEARKRQQEEETRRKREEQAKKLRQEDDARRKAKEAKKQAIATKQKKLKQQEEMDKEMSGLMEDMGAEDMSYDKKDKQPKESNMLSRGVMDSIFGGGSIGNAANKNGGARISAPGKPILGFQRDQGNDKDKQSGQKEDSFSGKTTTKLWRPI